MEKKDDFQALDTGILLDFNMFIWVYIQTKFRVPRLSAVADNQASSTIMAVTVTGFF